MGERIPEHDPHSRLEDAGIPDLQDGTPQQQWAVDPQEAPLPGDVPVGLDEYGTTADEQFYGEPLEIRVSREIPEEQALFGGETDLGARSEEEIGTDLTGPERPAESIENGLGVGSDLDTDYQPDAGPEPGWEAQPEEPSGAVWDEPRRAGCLVEPDEGVREDTEPDAVGREVGPDMGGYTAEEAAMRVEPE